MSDGRGATSLTCSIRWRCRPVCREIRPDVMVAGGRGRWRDSANSTYPADFLLENLKIQNPLGSENAWRHGARRLLFSRQQLHYPKIRPPADHRRRSLGLTGPLEPTTHGMRSPDRGIELCRGRRQQHGFDAISLNAHQISIGPGDNLPPHQHHVLRPLDSPLPRGQAKRLRRVSPS